MDEIVERFYPRVRDIVRSRLESRSGRLYRRVLAIFSTNDIVQDVFVKLIRGLPDFAGDDTEIFVNYVGVLVRNTLLDLVRFHGAARRDQRRLDAPSRDPSRIQRGLRTAGPTPSGAASLREEIRLYREVLETFAGRQRWLLMLRIECGDSFADLAAALGFPSDNAARKAFHIAHAQLLVRLRARGLRH